MRFLTFLLALMFTFTAHAGFEGLQSSSSLKLFNRINCSTGLTCTRTAKGTFNMVSSPSLAGPITLESAEVLSNAVDDTVQVASNDEHTIFQVLGFEAKDASLNLFADQGDDSADKFGLKYSAAGALTFEINAVAFATFTGSTGALAMTGPLSGDGGDALSGFLQAQVVATATTITAAQCGKTFISAGAIEIELPEASTVLGCQLTFIVGNASAFNIDPDDADDIALLTNAAGDRIVADAIGESVVIQAISATTWAVVGAEKGTWSDNN